VHRVAEIARFTPLFRQQQIILLGDKGAWVRTTCPGIELYWSVSPTPYAVATSRHPAGHGIDYLPSPHRQKSQLHSLVSEDNGIIFDNRIIFGRVTDARTRPLLVCRVADEPQYCVM